MSLLAIGEHNNTFFPLRSLIEFYELSQVLHLAYIRSHSIFKGSYLAF